MPEHSALTDRPSNEDVELVIALIPAIGTDVDQVVYDLDQSFSVFGYRTKEIHVSTLIGELHDRAPEDIKHKIEEFKKTKRPSTVQVLMEKGDLLREAVDDGGAAAALAVCDIMHQRAEMPDRRVCWIVRSLKHPQEVEILRRIYGSRLFTIGVWCERRAREQKLENDLRHKNPEKRSDEAWLAAETRRLMIRDERDLSRDLGQKVRDAFPLADAFIAVRPGSDSSEHVDRIVRMLFGSPYETPTRDEEAMFHAFAAKLRSSAPGRQVGAVVADLDGEILVSGTNEVPKVGGGQYWAGDKPDLRDLTFGFDTNQQQKHELVTDLLANLIEAEWIKSGDPENSLEELSTRALTGRPLKGTRVDDLIEFTRAAHAEMATICTAARRTVAIQGGILYTTTYPCHECARLIISTGISKVVYIDPYPKSRISDMYPLQVGSDGPNGDQIGTIPFIPFEGIAPSAFQSIFTKWGRDKGPDGRYKKWDCRTAHPRFPFGANAVIEFAENEITQRLSGLLRQKAWEVDSVLPGVG